MRTTEVIDLNDYTIDTDSLSDALDKEKTGAIEFSVILRAGNSAGSVFRLFASMHGEDTKSYTIKLVHYLVSNGILKENKEKRKNDE